MAAGFRGIIELIYRRFAAIPCDPWDLYFSDDSDAAVDGLVAIGTVSGVVVTHASAGNAQGTGYQWAGHLHSTGSALRWRAPGSSNYGIAVNVAAGGTFHLVDGDSPDAWLEVQVYADHLSPEVARVLLQDRYNTAAAQDDVTAVEADAGDVLDYTLKLVNASGVDLPNAAVWLDPDATHLEISLDGINYSAPTTQGTGLTIATLAAESAETIYVRRTVTASATAEPYILAGIHAAALTRAASARGLWRIWNDPEYRFYWSDTAPPAEGATPDETGATLAHETTATFGDGLWYFSASYFNGCLDSGFLPQGTTGLPYRVIEIVDGVALLDPPYAPEVQLIQRSGLAWIEATYWQSGDSPATEWSLSYTVDGSAPAANTPDETEAIDGAQLVYALPAVASGTTVKVLLQVRRNDGTEETPAYRYSPAGAVLSLTVDTVGPAAPLVASTWRGKLPAVLE